MENLKILDLRVVENYNMKEIIGREKPDSPPAKQDASELINRITALCVFIYFLPLINPDHFPPKNYQNAT